MLTNVLPIYIAELSVIFASFVEFFNKQLVSCLIMSYVLAYMPSVAALCVLQSCDPRIAAAVARYRQLDIGFIESPSESGIPSAIVTSLRTDHAHAFLTASYCSAMRCQCDV